MTIELINNPASDTTLVHTLLFMFQQNNDLIYTTNLLKSLTNSSYKTVIVYNQGCLNNEQLKLLFSPYPLNFYIIGNGANVGTSAGRQKCFEYIWEHFSNTKYISELHLDMIVPKNWEDSLITYLKTNDEPLICSGIVDKNGHMPFLEKDITLPETPSEYPDFLKTLSTNTIKRGFTNPCIHVSEILKKTGGYNTNFLKGLQCFEDDSMLLGYYYYYGTKYNWHPNINYNSVVYHMVAGQRMNSGGNSNDNFNGLIKQYGYMGLHALSSIHTSPWHKQFFQNKYKEGIK